LGVAFNGRETEAMHIEFISLICCDVIVTIQEDYGLLLLNLRIYNGFRDRPYQPLWHLSAKSVLFAENVFKNLLKNKSKAS
jgi:hypothetical protein